MGFWNDRYRDMPAKEKDSLKRVVFFRGTIFFSSRPLLGFEQQNLPVTLVDGQKSEGDVLRVMTVQCFTLPAEMTSGSVTSAATRASVDHRCSNCTSAFSDFGALVSHCKDTGHSPVINDETPQQALPSVFLSYCNVALTQAMSERMCRWGRDFVDPQSFREPEDRNGNKHGIRVVSTDSCSSHSLYPRPRKLTIS